MKIPDFHDVNEENVFEYELCRNFLGWQLSYAGGDLATFISKEEAEQIINMMEKKDEDTNQVRS